MTDPGQTHIRLEKISKRYGTVQANKDISLDIHTGKIKALLGENGAGKSTLMGILAGQIIPDSGQIRINDRPVAFGSTKTAISAGIGMVYQHFKLVEAMTVTENVFLGQEKGFWLKLSEMHAAVRNLAAQFGLDVEPEARISSLSMGERQRVEILKLLLRESRFLIFDEPTAVLTPNEIGQLFEALKQMAAKGKAIVFISHKLDEVMALADEIAVLRRGEVVDTMDADEVDSKAELARRMVGREIILEVDKPPVETRQLVLRARNLSDDPLKDVSFDLRQGEILGIVGVAGNGQKPLLETICGLKAPGQGSVQLLGKPWKNFFARRPWDAALSYIPEDRQGLATCIDLDLTDNFLLTTRKGFCTGPWLKRGLAEKKAADAIQNFDIHPPDVKILARQLSGGNLQKMVLAREFYCRPRLIVAEQPTQGLDIAATEDIWKLLLKARDRAGILLVTGDLTEALALADRVAVMFRGQIMDTFHISESDKVDRIGLMMAGIP